MSAAWPPLPLGEGGGEGGLGVAEPSAKYLTVRKDRATQYLERLIETSGGTERLRALIRSLAVQGKLVRQTSTDEPAIEAIGRMAKAAKRSMPAVQDAVVPTGWVRLSFGDYAISVNTGPFGSLIGKNDYVEGGVPLVNPSHMKGGRIHAETGVAVSPAKARELSAYRLTAGDLVFARRGEVGRTALVGQGEDGWLCGTGSFFAQFHPWVNRQYLQLAFDSDAMRRHLTGAAIGTTMVNLNQRVLRGAPIDIPPLAEQHRIVARVDELMKLCDALEANGRLADAQHARLTSTLFEALAASESAQALAENWQRVAEHFDLLLDRPKTVDALEQIVLRLAVHGKLVEQSPNVESASKFIARMQGGQAVQPVDGPFDLPPDWAWCTLEAIATVGTGTTPSRTNAAYFQPAEIPWVNSGETGRPFIESTVQHVSQFAIRETSLKLYPPGTLIVAMYGQGRTRGQVSELMIRATTNQACAAIVPFEPALHHRRYLKLFFEKSYDDLRAEAVGGAQPNLNVGKIKSTLLPLPPLAEQERIVARVEELRRLCADLRARLTQSQQTQARLADALVAQATA